MRKNHRSSADTIDNRNIVIWGAGGHAKVVADIIRIRNEFSIEGFLDDVAPERAGEKFVGGKVLAGSEATLKKLREEGVVHMIIAVGNCAARLRLMDNVCQMGFTLPAVIHPFSSIAADVSIGEGCVVAAGAVINPGSSIGRGVIVNTCASVDHDCNVGDGVHICPGSRLAGGVKIGALTWIGIGSSIKDGVTIGNNVLIGAGSVVVNDICDNMVAYGVPANANSSSAAV